MDRRGSADRLSSLPDSLLCEVLSNLSTADVVRTSVLSSRWRNLWKNVPVLDLDMNEFPEQDSFVSFVDRFLGFNSESCFRSLELELRRHLDGARVTRWIKSVVDRKVKHVNLLIGFSDVEMPTTLYTCGSLVSLALYGVTLPSPSPSPSPNPSPKFVSLPCLKDICLNRVKFADDLAFEMLISASPLLESLFLVNISYGNVNCFRVCSKSLLSLTHIGRIIGGGEKDVEFAIDAPRLHDLHLLDGVIASFIVKNLGSLVKVDLDIGFKLRSGRRFDPNNLPKINMIRSFFHGISTAKRMAISWDTLEVVYDYLRCQPLPLFLNLSSMRATSYKWHMLLAFLESCPNLKRLVLESSRSPPEEEGISILSGRPCFLSSLEYVEIQRPWTNQQRKENPWLVTYFLDNSTLCLDDSRKEGQSVILKRPLTTPRLNNPQEIDSILG